MTIRVPFTLKSRNIFLRNVQFRSSLNVKKLYVKRHHVERKEFEEKGAERAVETTPSAALPSRIGRDDCLRVGLELSSPSPFLRRHLLHERG